MIRGRVATVLLAGALALAGAGAASAHGPGEEGVDEFAKQPAKVLVQQAHALLLNGEGGDEVMMRIEGAELSHEKSGVDADRLEAAHEALEKGNRARAIELLEQALAGSGADTSSHTAEERIHGAAATFRPGQGAQELGGAIAGGTLLVLAFGGLAWRRRRDAAL